MALQKITARLGQGMLCHRRAPSAELPCIPSYRKPVVLQFRRVVATYHTWRDCSSPEGRGGLENQTRTALPLLPCDTSEAGKRRDCAVVLFPALLQHWQRCSPCCFL